MFHLICAANKVARSYTEKKAGNRCDFLWAIKLKSDQTGRKTG